MRGNKEFTHSDFYKHFKKNHPEVVKEMGIKWIPERWTPRYDYFQESNCHGWRSFVKALPEDIQPSIQNMVFEFLTKPLDIQVLLEKMQTTVNNYWNKIVVCKTIDNDEERKFKSLINGLKELSELSKIGTLRVSPKNVSDTLDNIDAERFTCSEVPPDSKLIKNRAHIVNDRCWWEVNGINIPDLETIYFKSNEPKRVPEMKCTFQDGIFMAIPSELLSDKKLTERFTKLLTDNGESVKHKINLKKKKLTSSQLSDMDYHELVQVIKDYDLDIPYDDLDDEDDIDGGDLDNLQNDIERGLGIR